MQSNARLYLLVFFIVLVGFTLIFRLFSLQVLRYDFYKELAANQHQIHQILFPKRGEIFIKDRFYGKDPLSQLFPLAVNREWPMVYAIPREIENREEVVKILAPLLEIDEEILRKKINKRNDPYEPLKHKLSQDIVEKIKKLNIKGIEFMTEDWRHFPADSLASHIVGFVGFSNDIKVGQYGIEEYYNKELEGKYGFLDDFYFYRGFNDTIFTTNEVVFVGYGIDDKKYSDFPGATQQGEHL